MKTNISYFDLSNCRIQARLESMKTGRVVTCTEVLERELNKAKNNQKSLIDIVYFVPEQDDKPVSNIGKTIIVEQETGNISRYTVVLNSNEVNPDLNIVSTRSNIGRILKTVNIDDIVEINGQLWHIMDIIEPSATTTA
jgi:hypothetical protein